MGLDFIAEGCARPGHEDEWRRIVRRAFGDEALTEAETARFAEISIPAYQRVGAPRVGFDSAADAWIVAAREAKTPEDIEVVLKEFHGFYVLRLVECDGIPRYSNSRPAYDEVDETSFRGTFLEDCTDVLEAGLLATAWQNMWPPEAVAYGEALLEAADRAEGETRPLLPSEACTGCSPRPA